SRHRQAARPADGLDQRVKPAPLTAVVEQFDGQYLHAGSERHADDPYLVADGGGNTGHVRAVSHAPEATRARRHEGRIGYRRVAEEVVAGQDLGGQVRVAGVYTR